MFPAPTGLAEHGFGSVLLESMKLLFILIAPFIAFAIVIHWFELVTQRRLAGRFGWRSVLWTGWLGTPVHELSHALVCRIFQHRIEEVALFEPDRESGRLGFVKHSFRKGNLFQEIGNLFIGIAPLLGGSIVLAILLWVFYRDAASTAIESTRADYTGDAFARMFAIVGSLVGSILTLANLGTVRFWTFLYLVLCVGSHMAPSGSDYQGASRGVFLFGGIVLVGVFILAMIGIDSDMMVDAMISTMGPLFAILGLTVVLCGITTIIVWLITSFFPQRFKFTD